MIRKNRLTGFLFLLAIISFSITVRAEGIKTGEALLRAMHARYQNNWYETLTFTQQSITHKPDGTTSSETWHEALLLPGKLRIDIGMPQDGNGMIFNDGTLSVFKDGKLTRTTPFVHGLLVLGFDVYRQPPEKTIEQAKQEGFDLSKLHEETWHGEPVYVVGADKGDLKSKQFWVEKKRLLFVRLLEQDRHDATKTADSRFIDYRKESPGWVAAGVEFYVDGKEVFSEEYSDIVVNPKLNPAIFDAAQFATQHWEK